MELEQLYRTYERPVYTYLYGLTGDTHLAEELTQETFFQVVRSIYRFRGDASLTTWLYGVARNVYRSWRRRRGCGDVYLAVEEEAAPFVAGGDPARELLRQEEIARIRSILLAIPERYREILLLRDHQGLHYQEIAAITGLSLASVKMTIHRARRRFRELYQEKG